MKAFLVLPVCLLLTGPVLAQVTAPRFESGEVRPGLTDKISMMPTLDVPPDGVFRIGNRRLDEIIMLAYNVGGRQLSGPRWLTAPNRDSDAPRFDILAKVPAGTKSEQMPLMLQNLLEERFGLKVHREPREMRIYALTVGKDGTTLKPAVRDASSQAGCVRITGTTSIGAMADCRGITAAQLAQQLPTLAPGYFREGPVVDRTELTGTYDLQLQWMRQEQLDAGLEGPTMFAAVRKFGLELETVKERVEMLVVDKCEQKPVK